jgi:hypothetical protein
LGVEVEQLPEVGARDAAELDVCGAGGGGALADVVVFGAVADALVLGA